MKLLLKEKIRHFDRNKNFKDEIDRTMVLLKRFREKYPFVKEPNLIDDLKPNDIFTDLGEVGDFFLWIEYHLKPLGHLYLFSKVYRNIRDQIDDFKNLLHKVVDPTLSISDKVDANWNEIKRMGGDKHIAKKIIFCYNYESNTILPIFKTSDLKHFYRTITEPQFSNRYSIMSPGEKYEFLNSELINIKKSIPETKAWDFAYFSRFLYETFPPPREIGTTSTSEQKEKEKENRKKQKTYAEFIDILNQLRRKEKISAFERREYDQNWRNQPERRDIIEEELNRKL